MWFPESELVPCGVGLPAVAFSSGDGISSSYTILWPWDACSVSVNRRSSYEIYQIDLFSCVHILSLIFLKSVGTSLLSIDSELLTHVTEQKLCYFLDLSV